MDTTEHSKSGAPCPPVLSYARGVPMWRWNLANGAIAGFGVVSIAFTLLLLYVITHGDGFTKNLMAAFWGTALCLCQVLVATALVLIYFRRCTRLRRVAEIIVVLLIILAPVATATMVILRLFVFRVSSAW